MKRNIGKLIILGLVLIYSSLFAAQSTTTTYWAIGYVYDQGGNPVSGVQVKFWVYCYSIDNSTIPEVIGTTGTNGGFTLSIQINNVEYPYLHSLGAVVSDARYTTLSATGNYSTTGRWLYPSFTVLYDQDRDGIDDDVEMQIAEKFKPILHKHSYDLQQGLANFEKYIIDGRFTLKVYNDVGQLLSSQIISGSATALHKWSLWNWDTYGYGTSSSGAYNLDLNDNYRYLSAPIGMRPLYFHVYKQGNYFYVQYWYYFGMDDKREQLSGAATTYHESDWEHISIRLSQNQNGIFTPNLINFYIHDGGLTASASDCWWSPSYINSYNNIVQGYDESHTHLHVWIAANGHASYNRNWIVYKRCGLGICYQDRVDYSAAGNDLYFVYDYMINLGEVEKCTWCNCPDNGYNYPYHCYSTGTHNIPWLAYVGRTGEWNDPIVIVGAKPPLLPAHEAPNKHSHEWLSFSEAFSGFGNDGASWVVDTSLGD